MRGCRGLCVARRWLSEWRVPQSIAGGGPVWSNWHVCIQKALTFHSGQGLSVYEGVSAYCVQA